MFHPNYGILNLIQLVTSDSLIQHGQFRKFKKRNIYQMQMFFVTNLDSIHANS